MSEKKNWGSTVMGWFVVRDDDAPDGAPAPEAAETAGATDVPASVPPVEPVGELPAATGGQVDFDAVFEAFGIGADARDRVAKAADLLKALPAGTDPAVKRQIALASLKAFGVPIEQIIETACEQLQALDGYQRKGGDGLAAFCAEAERKIAAFEDQVRRIREEMGQRADEQKTVVTQCNARKLDVQQVLEFFGQEAVARVVRESPKLVDPSQAGPSQGQPAR